MTKLEELLKIIKNNSVYVQMHNYPDQDAIASAMGLKYLLEKKGKRVVICYKGVVDKFNTIKMIQELGIEIVPIDKIAMSENDEIIIVDGQKGNTNMEDLAGREIACIDHHKKMEDVGYAFSDIRSNMGACSTIITSYFQENHIAIDQRLATALIYGIKMDTDNLSRGVTDLDIDMYCYLYKKANISKIKNFDNSSLHVKDLNTYVEAISNLRIYQDIGVADTGKDCPEPMIGTVSDFLLTLTDVVFTLVYSYRANGLKCSVRSEDRLLDACFIIRQALNGLGDGGGHASMAAGFVPDISGEEEAKRVAELVEGRVIETIDQIRELYLEQVDKDNYN